MIAVVVLASRAPVGLRDLRAFVPAGVLFGLSYICLFEAYYRGPVTVVSPLVATESLWGVAFSALLLKRVEGVGHAARRRRVTGGLRRDPHRGDSLEVEPIHDLLRLDSDFL